MLRLLACLFLLIATHTSAQSSDMNAVGRVELGAKGFCTGTLIASDLVLTAAHCLYDKSNGARFDAGQLTFRAGYRDGQSVALRQVRRAVVHPDYQTRRAADITNLPNDLALLQLDHPVPAHLVRPLAIASPDLTGTPVGVMSYGLERAERPQMESACAIAARPEGIYVTTCQASLGTSGAPVVQLHSGIPRVVSVVSAMARADGRPVALAADVSFALGMLRERMAATEVTALR